MTITAELDATVGAPGSCGRTAAARALVGSAHLPGHLRGPRPRGRREGHLLHDRARRRQVPRLLAGARRRCPEPTGAGGRVRGRQRSAERRAAAHQHDRHADRAGGRRPSWRSSRRSRRAMEQLLSMGMEEGFTAAIGQIPGILAEQVPPGAECRLGRWISSARVCTITRSGEIPFAAVQHTPVVPHHEVAWLPMVFEPARRLAGPLEQIGEQGVRLLAGQARDGVGVAADEQRRAAGHRVHLHQRPQLRGLVHAVAEVDSNPACACE